jgi:hippurate hydrolase
VIPHEARLAASVRTFSPAARDRMLDALPRLVSAVASAHGLSATAEFLDGYPLTVNDAAEVGFAEQTIADVLGAERFVRMPDPVTGSEDFSFVLDRVPGAYLMLGACPPGTDLATAPFNHSPEAVFDDSVLADGTALLAELALRKLS